MALAEILTLYHAQDWEQVIAKGRIFLEKSEEESPYFTRKGIPPALYCLGIGELWGEHNLPASLRDMNGIIAEGTNSSRWVTFAMLRRGQIYDLKGEREKAVADYHAVLERPDIWGSQDEAQIYLRKPFAW